MIIIFRHYSNLDAQAKHRCPPFAANHLTFQYDQTM